MLININIIHIILHVYEIYQWHRNVYKINKSDVFKEKLQVKVRVTIIKARIIEIEKQKVKVKKKIFFK